MLFHLLYPLHTQISAFNVFRYITFRTIYASLTAFLICFLLGPFIIRKMKDCDTYFHPETGMVFKSKTERKVIGVLVKNDIATLTTDHINLCKKWGFVIST